MSGVYDRFNRGLSNGIRVVDAGERMIANEQQQQQQSLWIQQQAKDQEELRIIRTELLEMVKIMEMHRQNQIKREEETEAEIANMKKAKWRQIYYSTLKEKKAVNEEEEESLEESEPELEPNTTPQLPSSLLTTPPTPSPSFPSPPLLEQEL